ncbi:hypothetical protein RRG08_059966, partial [Elysia crispata]
DVVCDYHLTSLDDGEGTISLELLTFSRILCEQGSLTIYDGADAESPVLLNWCYPSQPFSRLSGSSSDLFIRFSITESQSDWFVFRAKVYPISIPHHVYPNSISHHVYPNSITHHVYPISISHHVYPISIPHHVYPISIPHHVYPISITHHVYPISIPHHVYPNSISHHVYP